VLHLCHMSNTLTIRLPKELLERLRHISEKSGLPVGRLIRESLQATLPKNENNPLLKFAGVIKGGPRNLSSRRGFSRD
jgi:predicted DNA-binding protein